MHTHMTHDGKITIHHNSDWSGDVEVVACDDVRQDAIRTMLAKPRSTTIPGVAVLSGDYDRPNGCQVTERELRRATALAVWVRTYQESIAAAEKASKPEGL